MRAIAKSIALAVALAACGGVAPELRQAGVAVLAIEGLPEGAVVSIDERAIGVAEHARRGLAVGAGTRRLAIDAAGYLPYRLEINLEAGHVFDLHVELWPCFIEADRDCVIEGP